MHERASNHEPIFVTGVGVVSPAGADTETSWQAMMANTRCVQTVTDPAITGGGGRCAGLVPGFKPPVGMENADRVCQLAVSAADQAMMLANLNRAIGRSVDPAKVAISFGTSKGGILAFGNAFERYISLKKSNCNACTHKTSSGISPEHTLNNTKMAYLRSSSNRGVNTLTGALSPLLYLSDITPDAPARHFAGRYGMTGVMHATVGACATGTLALIRAVQMIRDGHADIVLAGSADASLHPLWFAAFHRMRVLSEPHDELGPGWSCRPFDRHRSGFAIAEGAAVLVIESARSAQDRKTKPLARIAGYAMGADPSGLTAVNPSGTPLAEVILIACRQAGITPDRIAAVQAHGTGTIQNDLAEINALRACGICNPRIPVSSFKGALGHMLGAAGAVELAIAILSIQRGMFAGNVTLLEPDPKMGPTWLPVESVPISGGPMLKTSLGFGGHLAAVIIDRP